MQDVPTARRGSPGEHSSSAVAWPLLFATTMSDDHKQHFGTITIIGEGSVTARPDVANVRLGVRAQARTAQDAATANAEVAGRVIAAVRLLGIPEQAIQTDSLTLEHVYEWDEATKSNVLVGYRVNNSVHVRSPLDKVAAVFDAGVAAGANEGGDVSFGLHNDVEARHRALKLATTQAHEHAEMVAKRLRVELGGPLQVEILDGVGAQPRELTRKTASPTPIMAGELEVIERVKVVFETKL